MSRVYLGPYIKCKKKSYPEKIPHQRSCGCSAVTHKSRFCPSCGGEYEIDYTVETRYTGLFDYDESERLVSVSSWKSPDEILISNQFSSNLADGGWGGGLMILPLDKKTPEASINEFKKQFKETIELVRENVESLEFCFGLVQYYD